MTTTKRTKQYAVHLPPDLVADTREMADEDDVAVGNWSRWVELVLRAVLKKGKR